MDEPADSLAGDGPALAREYYQAIDAGEYAALEAVLAPEFTHVRGDRTLSGRADFVDFMAEKRPEKDTSHDVDRVYTGPHGVAVTGQLRRANGELFFRFVDVFQVTERLVRLVTYSNTD
ncbi:MAG: nuclear transport factor 2 family protein [Halodesulfurarchaeum sp.]